MREYLYFVTENGRVFAPFEHEIDEIFDVCNNSGSSSNWYITKSGKLCNVITYADEIDYDDNLGRANYSHWTKERTYYGKVIAKFKKIEELVKYLKEKK